MDAGANVDVDADEVPGSDVDASVDVLGDAGADIDADADDDVSVHAAVDADVDADVDVYVGVATDAATQYMRMQMLCMFPSRALQILSVYVSGSRFGAESKVLSTAECFEARRQVGCVARAHIGVPTPRHTAPFRQTTRHCRVRSLRVERGRQPMKRSVAKPGHEGRGKADDGRSPS